jgi:hypothetical protein
MKKEAAIKSKKKDARIKSVDIRKQAEIQ